MSRSNRPCARARADQSPSYAVAGRSLVHGSTPLLPCRDIAAGLRAGSWLGDAAPPSGKPRMSRVSGVGVLGVEAADRHLDDRRLWLISRMVEPKPGDHAAVSRRAE